MKLLDDIKSKTLIICSNSHKKRILKEMNNYDRLFPVTFMTREEFLEGCYFKYDEESIYFLMSKYHIKYDIALTYIRSLIYLDNRRHSNNKLKYLDTLKDEVKDLLIYDYGFKDYVSSFDIYVYGYYIDMFFDRTLSMFDRVHRYKEDNEVYEHSVYHFKNIEDEVSFVCMNIIKLYNSGVDLNGIKIVNATNNYNNVFKRLSLLYNIPIEGDKVPLYYTSASEYLLSNFDSDLSGVINDMYEKYDNDIVSLIVSVINKYTFVDDKKLVRDMIVHDLKNNYINKSEYVNSCKMCTFDDIDRDDYVFIVGFEQNSVPRIYRDEDYLSDAECDILGIENTLRKNIISKEKTINIINHTKNVIITYKDDDLGKVCYPSTLINELNMKVIDEDITFSYSNNYNKYKLCSMLDMYYKYNIFDSNMNKLYNTYNPQYKSYSNKFTGVSFDDVNRILNNNLVLSYSAMEGYNECSFKYYINNILKLDVNEEKFSAFIGTLFHHVFEVCLKRESDIDEVIDDFIKDKSFSFKETFYIDKLRDDIKFAFNTIKYQMGYSKFNEFSFENKLLVNKNKKINCVFKGFADKIMFYEYMGRKLAVIVDYKTSDIDVKMDLIDYGINLQLPIYLYLINNIYDNVRVVGFYIQRVLPSDNKYDKNKELIIRKRENMRLIGYSNIDSDVLSLFDSSYRDSNVIRGLKVNNDGSFNYRSKVISDEEMKNISNKIDSVIDKSIDNILSCDFDINPKRYKNVNISCKFCKYKDICYMSNEDIVDIKEEVDA